MGLKSTPNGGFSDMQSDSTDKNAAITSKSGQNPTLAMCATMQLAYSFRYVTLFGSHGSNTQCM